MLLERATDALGWEPALQAGKTLGVLVHLESVEHRYVSRDRLADLLWDGDPLPRARASLRQSLHTLRKVLGDGAILADREQVALAPGVIESDRERFVAATRAGDWATMVALYAGDFCASMDIVSSDGFARWATVEQAHLRQSLLAESARLAPAAIAASPASALGYARALFAVASEEPVTVAVLADALVATGRSGEARERLQAAVRSARMRGEAEPVELSRRLARLDRAPAPTPTPRGSAEALGQSTVGREEELAALVRISEQARASDPRRVLVSAPAGFGKSRLLDEFESRVRLRGWRVVRVQCLPAARDVPYSTLADVVRGLGALPGVLGVMERTAEVLVALVPELARSFPSVRSPGPPIGRADAAERGLERRTALTDLLAAVAEERPVALLLDDLHHADEASRAVLASVVRRSPLRLLEVWTTRHATTREEVAADAALTLPAWTESQVREVLGAVAVLPDAPWVEATVQRLCDRTAGVPHRVIRLLRLATASGLLETSDGGWRCADAERLADRLAADPIWETELAAMPERARGLLLLLAVWARPMDERDLVALATEGSQDRSEVGACLGALRLLESGGWVLSRDAGWRVAHETVREAALQSAGADAVASHLVRLIGRWGTDRRSSMLELAHLARLCGAADSPAAAEALVRAASRLPSVRGLGIRGRALARQVAIGAGHPEWEARLSARIAPLRRLGPGALAVVAAAASVALVALVWLGAMLRPRLVVEVEPMADATAPPRGARWAYQFAVLPRVSLQDGFGRVLALRAPVRVRMEGARVLGDTVAELVDGAAQFTRLSVIAGPGAAPPAAIPLRFTGPWYVRPVTVPVRGAAAAEGSARMLRVMHAAVNGRRLADSLVASVPLGDSVTVEVTFEYTTEHATANYVVGASPTWGRRERDLVRLAGLPSPVRRGWRTVAFRVGPPPSPGAHHIIILAALEDGVDYLFSSTNWTMGAPVWYDGNDAVDATFEALEALRRTGRLPVPDARMSAFRLREGVVDYPGAGRPAPPGSAYRQGTIREGAAIRLEVAASSR